MESTVRELPRAAQLDRKAKLDAGLVDTVFQVGDQVMLRTKELLDVADIGKLRPPWEGPFEVTAKPSPNAYTLALPARMWYSRTINVDRLKAYHARVGQHSHQALSTTQGRRASTRSSSSSTARRRGG